MKEKLHQPIDNAPLVVFRIFFGFLIAAESFGAMATGWVTQVLVKPTYHFTHIGFEWLSIFKNESMYVYFTIMGIMGLCVMIGYRYKLTLGIFTVLWTGTYLMQKIAYNNHYYLLILVCILMLFLPANRKHAWDASRNPAIKTDFMPQWVSWTMILQMGIVYFFATVAKFYPGWLDGSFTRIVFERKTFLPFYEEVFSKHYFHLFIAYSGIFFDGFIIFFLLWKRTRTLALLASFVFHIFNAITLGIGIFPFFALSFLLFFYPPTTIRKVFFRREKSIESDIVEKNQAFATPKFVGYFLILFFTIQIILPLRHWFIPGDVLLTEEGHRLSWRMMLRSKSGEISFKIVDVQTKDTTVHYLNSRVLSYREIGFVNSKPDGVWQYAQQLKEEYLEKGQEVQIFADAFVSINQSPLIRLIDPNVDLAKAKWNYFGHNEWVLLSEIPSSNKNK